MEGTVATYLPSRGYGFAKGDDGRDYFLHRADLQGATELVEGQRISFSESSTPRGYRARRVSALETAAADRYQLPPEILTSKSATVPGWEVLQTAPWLVTGESRDSPDAAWDSLRFRAQMIGANAVINARYFKTTGSEAGSRRGTHHFTIHNVVGSPVLVGRRSMTGPVDPESLPSIHETASAMKRDMDARTRASDAAAGRSAGILIGISLLLGVFKPEVAVAGTILGVVVYLLMRRHYGHWLEPRGY
jgi:cold shock CspA family protein